MRSDGTSQPSRCAPTPSEVTNGIFEASRAPGSSEIEVVVVIVRHDDRVDCRQRAQCDGYRLKAFGPSSRDATSGPRQGRSERNAHRSRSRPWNVQAR